MSSLGDLASHVTDGDVVAFGGKTLHRVPSAFARELVRREVRDLTVLGIANSIEIDLLCGAGCVSAVHFGYVGFEGLGLAPNFRRTVEAGDVTALEGTCYTVATMLRGAKAGAPFMPVAGLEGSDLPAERADFTRIESPFTGEETYVVRTVTPDVGVIHAVEGDPDGNARFFGADLTENLVAKAADRTVVTVERLVEEPFDDPDRTDIPGVLVDAIGAVPYGAYPCSCPGEYDYDREALETYLEWSKAGELDRYLARLGGDEAEYRARVGVETEDLAWRPGASPAR